MLDNITGIKKTKKQVTNVVFSLDMSGSMNSMRDEAIGMINAQVETLQKEQETMGEVLVSLVIFGYRSEPTARTVFAGVPVDDVTPITRYEYLPQGMTPMRDGIGIACMLGEELDSGNKEDAVLCVIVTDGYENNSREWTPEMLADKIITLKETERWTFQVLGANIDVSSVSNLGIKPYEFSVYNGTAKGMENSSAKLADSLGTYSTCRGAGLTNTAGLNIEDDNED